MRRLAVMAAAALLAGCTAQEQAQQRLIGSMQSGLKELAAAQEQRQELVDGFYQQRRRVLDDAFDQDVRTVEMLEPQWVIEHRRAYMLACEALWKQQQASARAGEQMQQNLRTISEGLSALSAVSRMREQWGGLLEGEEDGNGK
jgi:hypothetical protein